MSRTMIQVQRSDMTVIGHGYMPEAATDDEYIVKLLDDDETAAFYAALIAPGLVKMHNDGTFYNDKVPLVQMPDNPHAKN